MKAVEHIQRTLVSTFLQLSEMRGLLDEIEDVLSERLVGDRPC